MGIQQSSVMQTQTFQNRLMFTRDGSYPFTVPVGVTKIRVLIIGKGGNGGSGVSSSGGGHGAGGGGGSGGKGLGEYKVTEGTSYTVTVGSTASFGALLSCTEGSNGASGSGGTGGAGGSGGTVSGANIISIAGSAGTTAGTGNGGSGGYGGSISGYEPSTVLNTDELLMGASMSAIGSEQCVGGVYSATAPGLAGESPTKGGCFGGGGGGGGAAGAAGAAGSGGFGGGALVLVEWQS